MLESPDPYPIRKTLCHHPPFPTDDAWYFITICAEDRTGSPFTDRAAVILDATRHYHRIGKWFVALFLVMPDHLHAIIHVPMVGGDVLDAPRSDNNTDFVVKPSAGGRDVPMGAGGRDVRPYRAHTQSPYRGLARTVGDFKTFLTRKAGLAFQRDFFDTRLRDAAHYDEKFRYVCANPVRKGLCATPRDWPHVIAFDRATGAERTHR